MTKSWSGIRTQFWFLSHRLELFCLHYLWNHHAKITLRFLVLIFRQLVSLLRINQINELGIQHDSKFNFEESFDWIWFVENITTDGNTVGLLYVPNDKGVDCIYISEVDLIRTDSKLINDTEWTNSILVNGHLSDTKGDFI